MSLVQSARLNGHDPWAYLSDVLTRLPTQQQPRRTVASPLASSLLSELHGSAAVVKGGAASRLRPERFTSLDYHAASLSRNAIVLIAIHSRRPKNSLQFAQALRHPNECHVFGRLRPLAEFCQFASGSVE